ncbi:tetratricopeptide repeat protein [Pedobacter boryungensis]|uniref:Tetratricopeptide repeat protein n=1 Tax=Pedobacter boryungensis TaxID=869962 RepID=A0ABX2DG23_9SPHI|nr:tetratricopeptide repeat protein [Pedobacter boryungensis]NQX33043.1 tetratricopeptide repeat protein [Pedobacter boryungensis]
MDYLKKTFLLLFIVSAAGSVYAQGNYEKMGTQAWMKGDYKTAVAQLSKADNADPNNVNVLRMLAYSNFQCGDFENAITAYSRLIVLKPNDYSAYYYRGKARLNIANLPKEALNQMRENFYTSAIKDFSKAIEINGEEDTQILQNRGIAYKDYAIFKSYKIKKATEKAAVVAIFNNSIADFQKVLTIQPLRKDIISLIDYVKAQITSLK